jgi:rfaE bifunctional protein nucleotidyltransferase chain/domain
MAQKIIPQSGLASLIKRLRAQRKKIVFTNGTFDLLHLGHVTYLQKARKFGDVLIAGVNSDKSVKTYKNPDRPINPEEDRMKVLAALECVDYVVLFKDPTPLNLILKVRPDVLVKGADWKKEQVAGAHEVESWGGKVKLIKLVPNRSTTRLINLMKSPTG